MFRSILRDTPGPDRVAAAAGNGPAKRALAWTRRLGDRALDRLGRITNDRIARPGAHEMLARQHAQDADDNRAATPGPDSHVELLGVWAFEAFTPSTVGPAMDVMRRRGWSGGWTRRSDRDLVGWLEERRRVGGEGTHEVHLGRPGTARMPSIGQEADLPAFAASAIGQLVTVTPSISGLLLFFIAKPETARAIETVLRTDVRSRMRSEGHSMVVVDPEVSRQEAIETLRMGWRDEIADFFRTHAPGVFSDGSTADFPTCELLVGEGFPFFESLVDGQGRSLPAEILEVAYASGLFDAEEDVGVSLAFGAFRSDALASHAVLATTRAALEGTVHSLNAPAGAQRHLLGANYRFRFAFFQWSLLELLRLYDHRLNAARDGASRIFRSWLGLGPLGKVQTLTAGLADAALVARELSVKARRDRVRPGGDYTFVLRPWRPSETRLELLENLRAQMRSRARALVESSREFNAHLSSQANLSSARANIWIQIVVSLFAILSLVFGGISAWEAATNLGAARSQDRTEGLPPSPVAESPRAPASPGPSASIVVPAEPRTEPPADRRSIP